ncbi:unnamed protein product, partial [Iphiclides podalirius]
MRVYDACCYALLAITVTACVRAETQHEQERGLMGRKSKGQLAKRDAAMHMDRFQIQNLFKHRPKFIYKRVSNQRYRTTKPKYAVTRTKYTVKPSRKIMRRYRNSVNPKYGQPSHSKRPPKFRYAHQKAPSYKSANSPLNRSPGHYAAEQTGFGEPPLDQLEYHFSSHGEANAYAAPQKAREAAPSLPQMLSDPIEVDHDDYDEQVQKLWHPQDLSDDANFAPSYKRPAYVKARRGHGGLPSDNPSAYMDFFNYDRPLKADLRKRKRKQKRKEAMVDGSRTQGVRAVERPEPQIVVGGRYAEPPARYFPYFNRNVPMTQEGGDFALADEAVDPDVTSSATISPYVNYKNGNVAFSPQNLNDAFSIVD